MILNLLNLYTLILALFGKVNTMVFTYKGFVITKD